MRAVVAELPGLKVNPFSDHEGRVRGLPDVDPELPQDIEVAFDVVRVGNIVDGAGPVRQSGRECSALSDCFVSRGAPKNFAGACAIKSDRYGRFITLTSSGHTHVAGSNRRVVRHSINDFGVCQQRLGFLIVDRRRRNSVRHRLGKGSVAKTLPLKTEIILRDKGPGSDGRHTELNRRFHDLFALRRSNHHR